MFNLWLSYFHVALTTIRHLLNVDAEPYVYRSAAFDHSTTLSVSTTHDDDRGAGVVVMMKVKMNNDILLQGKYVQTKHNNN